MDGWVWNRLEGDEDSRRFHVEAFIGDNVWVQYQHSYQKGQVLGVAHRFSGHVDSQYDLILFEDMGEGKTYYKTIPLNCVQAIKIRWRNSV